MKLAAHHRRYLKALRKTSDDPEKWVTTANLTPTAMRIIDDLKKADKVETEKRQGVLYVRAK